MIDLFEANLPVACIAAALLAGLVGATLTPAAGWAFRRWRGAERELWDCRERLEASRRECAASIQQLRTEHDAQIAELRHEFELVSAKLLAFELGVELGERRERGERGDD